MAARIARKLERHWHRGLSFAPNCEKLVHGLLVTRERKISRWHCALHPHPRLQSAAQHRLGSWEATGAPRRRPGSSIHQTEVRLDRPLPGDRRHRDPAARQVVHPRRRGRSVRSGWRCHLRCSAPPRHHHRGQAVRSEAMLYAFDLLEHAAGRPQEAPGEASGRAPARHRAEGPTDDGATIFRHACRMGLEGIVPKRLTAPYRSGPSRDWLKVKTGQPSDGPGGEAEW
jgi:hypothetical protein